MILFVKDGFHCANELSQSNAKHFEILSNTSVEFQEVKKNSHKSVCTDKVIRRDPNNDELLQIR